MREELLRIVAGLQSTRDRMINALTPRFGEAFDGDFDAMLEAINALKSAAAKDARGAAEKAGAEPVGRLTIDHFRGVRAMENVDFEYTGQLEPGTYRVYVAPPSQPVALPDGCGHEACDCRGYCKKEVPRA